ncbi:EF_hand domain-containing protein [Hexamita inflata]|uniref:EF hand domain-containing protein n=1 Tax=Hexamita inflata TaxID=28002 RepID=A0AA86P8Z4_9EUKA|nr:EF hand domain-containing protein [Hexamita inflata]
MQFKKPDTKLCSEAFTAVDTKRKSKLDAGELVKAFEKMKLQFTQEEVTQLVQLITIQITQIAISLEQFIHLIYICQNTSNKDTNRLLFLAADSQYAGVIDRRGVELILQRLGGNIKSQQTDDLMEAFTQDKNGKLTFEQFTDMMDILLGK